MTTTIALLTVPFAVASVASAAMAAPAAPTRTSATSTSAQVITTENTKFGTVLETTSGESLYVFSGDHQPFSATAAPQLDCTALNVTASGPDQGLPCTVAWPPLVATGGKLVGAGGVSSKALGTISRNGVTQVTYHGLPLYGFINDKSAHAVNGEDVAAFLGTWYLQHTNGQPAVETPTITPEVSSNGIILSSATAAGARTLYLLTTDNAQHSTCGNAGACDALWPPLLTNAKAKAATGVAGSAIGSVIRSDGTRQVTYNGHPVYFFALDLAAGATAGETNGEHILDPAPVNGVWYAVSPLGNPLPGTATIGSEAESATDSTQILSDTGAVNGVVGTLYAFTADTATHSACNSECARIWPPVLTSTPAAVVAASAAVGGQLGVVERIDGSFQVTYAGHPLYYFGLAFAGTSGNGATAFGGTFNIVNAATGAIIPAS